MKVFLSTAVMVILFSAVYIYGGGVWVNGYYRTDGTYVEGHYRSAPNDTKVDNYGPAQNDYERYVPTARDWDNDGFSNEYDNDDDDDGMIDDFDETQYGESPEYGTETISNSYPSYWHND